MNVYLFCYGARKYTHTLGKPGNSLSTIVATWNWSSFTSSAMTWAAAPLCSFLLSWLLILTMSASLWVKSSFKTEVKSWWFRMLSHIWEGEKKVSVVLYLVASWALHHYSRPYSQWRHRQHSYNHPLWSGELGVHAQDDVFFIRDALEDLMHTLRTQQDFLLLWVLINVFPLSIQLQAGAFNAWLIASTAPVTLCKP